MRSNRQVIAALSAIGLRWSRATGRATRGVLLAGALCGVLPAAASPSSRPEPAGEPATPETPREFFNAGTRKLREGKLREAEAFLHTALAAQDEAVQPGALYNLGHIRHAQGLEELKKGPSARDVSARARAALDRADQAVRGADNALAGSDVERLVESYMNGRGARRDLREATKAVRRALQTYGAALGKWERAASDFKSALELNPADSDARHNAQTVDRHIAMLVDSIREMQQAAAAMEQKKEQLGEKMKELKGRIPEEDMPPGAPGDEEEEEEQPMGTNPGEKEAPSRDGQELNLPEDLAGWLLESFKLDAERRLPMGQDDTAEPKNRTRKPW